MLNQYRIGQKLIAGFAIVLALLVAIWLLGRWASYQAERIQDEVDTAQTLSQVALIMQRDILFVVRSIKNEVITRQERYYNEAQGRVAEIIKTRKGDLDIMTPEDREGCEEILNRVVHLGELDKEYWDTEVRRKVSRAARSAAAGHAAESADVLLTEIVKTIDEQCRTTGNMGGTEVDCFGAKQIGWERQAHQLIAAITASRQMCFQYEASRDKTEQQRLLEDFEEKFGEIDGIVTDLKVVLVTNSTALEQLGSDLKTWMARTKETIDLENDLEKITVRVAEFVATLLDDIGHVLEKFGKEVHDAEAEAKTLNDRVQWVQMIVSIVTIIFGALISWVLTKNITSGLSSATGHLQVIAHEGDVSIEIPGFFLARKDEVGDLARAVKGIQDHFQVIERLAGSLANYDYSVEAKILSEKDTMGINLEHMIKEIGDAVHEINISAKQVATGSDEVSTAAQSLSNGSQEMAASLEQITATMHEISGQTKTNAVSAGQARDLAQASSKVAVEGQTIMHELIGAMDRITENSNEIQRVIKVVDDIAFQTNLLALNAAVEAARAGQHGKGFAVVAEEVRNLASRSAKAARETAELIAKSSQEIQRGDEIAAHTSGVFDTIVEQIKQTTDLVAGIATASNEQAQGVEQVSIGLHQIDGVTQSNSASAEESASAASEMNSMAKNLQALVAKFRLRDKA